MREFKWGELEVGTRNQEAEAQEEREREREAHVGGERQRRFRAMRSMLSDDNTQGML